MYGRTSPIDQTKMSDYRDETHFQANPQTKQLRNLETSEVRVGQTKNTY
jgi:hypothetical protein